MSYELIRPVASIESPDITQDFKVTKPHPDAVNDHGQQQLVSTANIFTSNKLIEKVLAATADFMVMPYDQYIKQAPQQFFQHAVVICTPQDHLVLRDLDVSPGATFISVNLNLTQGRPIVLQRQSMDPLLTYVLDFTPTEVLPEGLSHQAQLKLKFDLDGSTGFICQLP